MSSLFFGLGLVGSGGVGGLGRGTVVVSCDSVETLKCKYLKLVTAS